MGFFDSAKEKDVHTLDLYLTRYTELPSIPFELKPFLSEEEWESRLLYIGDIINSKCKPVLERLYVAFALTVTVVVPIILFSLLTSVSASRTVTAKAFVMDRFVGLAVVVIIGFVVWLPLVIWKTRASRHINKILSTWENLDRVRNQGADVPRISVKPPSIFRTVTLIRISTPSRTSSSQSSTFSTIPNFYFQNNPASAARAYFYPYQKPEKGMPHMSVVGGGFDYRTSVFKRGASEYDAKSQFGARSPSVLTTKAGSAFGGRRRPGESEYDFRRSSIAKSEFRTSTIYDGYFEGLDKKPVRTPIKGTMAGGRAATPMAMAVMPVEVDVQDDKW